MVVLRGGVALYAGVTMASVLAFLQHMAAQLGHLRPLPAGSGMRNGSLPH